MLLFQNSIYARAKMPYEIEAIVPFHGIKDLTGNGTLDGYSFSAKIIANGYLASKEPLTILARRIYETIPTPGDDATSGQNNNAKYACVSICLINGMVELPTIQIYDILRAKIGNGSDNLADGKPGLFITPDVDNDMSVNGENFGFMVIVEYFTQDKIRIRPNDPGDTKCPYNAYMINVAKERLGEFYKSLVVLRGAKEGNGEHVYSIGTETGMKMLDIVPGTTDVKGYDEVFSKEDSGAWDRNMVVLRAYPNPAVEKITLSYEVKEPSRISLKVYDVLGKEMGALIEFQREGEKKIEFDTRDWPSGAYLVRLDDGKKTIDQKFMVVK